MAKVVIVGLGNILLKDEGIGVFIAQELQKLTHSGLDLEIIDAGTYPDVLFFIKGVKKLIIVDAARMGGEPGNIYRFSPQEIEKGFEGLVSLHQISLPQVLKMMELFGERPEEIIVFGIEPAEIEWGIGLSPLLMERLPQIIKVISEEIEKEG